MTQETTPENQPVVESPAITPEPTIEPSAEPVVELSENFGDLLAEFEKSHAHHPQAGQQIQGTVISASADQVFLNIGFKIEGALPRSAFDNNAAEVAPGQTYPVSVTGRTEEGYYQLSRFKVAQPKDWSSLEEAFAQKLAVAGTVTAVVKGGATVDVGVRAFMPASRSGTRDAAELEALVGQQITCRITKLDVADEDLVVDRRIVLEEQAQIASEGRYAALKEGDILSGTVRSLMPYGAFLDLGGLDGLLHVSDIAWARITKPEDVVSVGEGHEEVPLLARLALALEARRLHGHAGGAAPLEQPHVLFNFGWRMRAQVAHRKALQKRGPPRQALRHFLNAICFQFARQLVLRHFVSAPQPL